MKKLIFSIIIYGLGFILTQCSGNQDELDAVIIDPATFLIAGGGPLELKANVDFELTTSCGLGAPDTSSSSTTTTTSTSSSSQEDVTKYTVESYIQFENDMTLLLKFTYDEEQERFRMIPTVALTCPTTDFINCNGITGTNPTCETLDNVTCGGKDGFVFVSNANIIKPTTTYFEASYGTIDWDEGFTIDTKTGQVELMHLNFDMYTDAGNIMSGSVRCQKI